MDNNQEELQLWRKYNDYLEGIAEENSGEFLNFVLWKQQQSNDKTIAVPLQSSLIESEFSKDLSKRLQLTLAQY